MEMGTIRIDLDNSEIFKQIFQNFLNSDASKDVTILGNDNTAIMAHRLILTGLSPVFKSLLSSSSHPSPIIFLPHLSGPLLKHFIDFMYTGQANVQHDVMEKFLDICRTFKIEGVDNMTEQTLGKHLEEGTEKHNRDKTSTMDESNCFIKTNRDISEYDIKHDLEVENANLIEKFFEDQSSGNGKQVNKSIKARNKSRLKSIKPNLDGQYQCHLCI